MYQAIHCIAGCQGHIGHQFAGGAVGQGYILGLGNRRHFGNNAPDAAIPLGIKGFGDYHRCITVVDHGALQNGHQFILMVCFQGDGSVVGIAYKQRIVEDLAVQHHGAFKAQRGVALLGAEIVNIGKLYGAAGGVTYLQSHFIFHFLHRAVLQGDILVSRGRGDLGNCHPGLSVPLGIEGLLHLYGNAAVIDNGILHNGEDLAAMGHFEANGICIGITHHCHRAALQLFAVQKNGAGEAQGGIVTAHTKVKEGGKLHHIFVGIAVDQLAAAGAHQTLTVYLDGIIGIFQGNFLECNGNAGVHIGKGAIGSEDQLNTLQLTLVRGDIDLKLRKFTCVAAIELQYAQLLAGIVVNTDLAVFAAGNIHIQHQGGVFTLFLCLGELEADTGNYAPGAGGDIHLQAVGSHCGGIGLGSVAIMLSIGAESQPVVKQLGIEHIVKLGHTVSCVQAVHTGDGLCVQGSHTVAHRRDADITLVTGQGHCGILHHSFFSVELDTVTGSIFHLCPGSFIAGDGQLGIRQEICNGDAV